MGGRRDEREKKDVVDVEARVNEDSQRVCLILEFTFGTFDLISGCQLES